MASYHSSFNYNDKNSFKDYGLIIAAFEPDDGFTDAFLGMENISDDYYDRTKRFDYGSRYTRQAEIQITLIKRDGSDMTVNEFRSYTKWLTGALVNSWLDMYNTNQVISTLSYTGDGITNEFVMAYPYSVEIVAVDGVKVSTYTRNHNSATLIFTEAPSDGSIIEIFETPPAYSFLGKILNLEQYKLDGRTVGIRLTFSSVSPWAYSAPQVFDRSIKQSLLVEDGILQKDPWDEMSIDDNGILYNGKIPDQDAYFSIDENGVLFIENNLTADVINETDDLYNYIYLDIEFDNTSCNGLKITNKTLDETTEIHHLTPSNIITLSAKQFIAEYSIDQLTGKRVNQNRIFGQDFNFVWPRLAPGENKLYIQGEGDGVVKFTYRYPMKVGDCAMDITTYGGGTACGDCDTIPSYNTVRWEDIIGTPTTLDEYGIADEVNEKIENIDVEWSDIENTPTTIAGYKISDAYTTTEIDEKIDNIEASGGGGSTNVDEDELNQMLNDILGT